MCIQVALKENAWILKIKQGTTIYVNHISKFFNLWMLLHDFRLDMQAEDDIIWKHANDGIYTASSAYKAQFLGLTLSPLDRMVWKAWAPPIVKFFSWLAIQDWIWTGNRLAKQGWSNCDLCPLSKQVQESRLHSFIKCHFTVRLWNLANKWLPIQWFFVSKILITDLVDLNCDYDRLSPVVGPDIA